MRREVGCAEVETIEANGTNHTIAILKTCKENFDKQNWELMKVYYICFLQASYSYVETLGFKDGTMKNLAVQLCMDADGLKNGEKIRMIKCDPQKGTQKWQFVH